MKNKAVKPFRQTNYLAVILVSLAFLAGGLGVVLYIGNQSQQETMRLISESVLQSRFNVDVHIEEEFQTLGTGVILNEEREWLAEDASFERMVRRLMGSNTYVRVGIASPEGEALWMDREGNTGRTPLVDAETIRRALAGEKAIGDTRWDERIGMYVNDYAIPVFDTQGALQGAMFASDPEDELRVIVDNSLFSNEGFAQIIDSDGGYVVKSRSDLRLAGDRDLFDLPYPLNEKTKQGMLDDMSAGRAGYLRIRFEDERRMAAYAPSKYNDWYIFYSVPEEKVNAGLRNITLAAMGAISIAGAVFLFLILMIRRSNTKNQQELERLAFVSPVTGGRNLQKFLIDAQKMLAGSPGDGYAICYGDIKGFKYINTIFGRAVGDQLLRHFWKVMEDDTAEDELSAHAGSDIFVALRRLGSKEATEERYRKATERMAVLSGTATKDYRLEIYGGVYRIDHRDGALSLEDMLDRALEAQGEAKRRGGGSRIGFYSNEMRAQKLWEIDVESKMEQALADHEFQMYLQPKIGIQQGDRIVGMEALVRWAHPGMDLLPPARFIGLFERNGFIIHLDRYMVEEVCRTYQAMSFARMDPPLVLSVNISRLSLLQPDIVQAYTRIKDRYGIPDGLIELEFTEGLLFEDHQRFHDIVEQFRGNGFLCSLDDFGAGYSSLNMLKSLDVDILKLDKLFFAYGENEARGRELVRVILFLAKSLHMKTVAEGVEDEEEVRWLRSVGCDAVQGYVFSKPLPLDAFMVLLAGWKGGDA